MEREVSERTFVGEDGRGRVERTLRVRLEGGRETLWNEWANFTSDGPPPGFVAGSVEFTVVPVMAPAGLTTAVNTVVGRVTFVEAM